jgi:outer membrane protein assembly factor BamE (lipoprotein component of BamABCDE complex)
MPIQVSCPQCQKVYVFPDDKRGKQVRCQDCFQVFLAGKPPADAPAEPEVLEPEIVPDPVPEPAPKPAARPQSAPSMRPTPKPAPQKASPRPTAAPRAVRESPRPTPAPKRRHRSGVMGFLLVAFLFLLFMAGGAGATVGVLWTMHVPPFQVAANTPPDGPKPDKTDPDKSDKNDPNKPPDKPANPPDVGPTSPLTKANFEKIEKGMTHNALVSLLGSPSQKGPLADLQTGDGETWNAGGVVIEVALEKGRTVGKWTNQDWPNSLPGAVAQNPPPDKPKPGITKENYARIAKGMTEKEVDELLGPSLFPNNPLPPGPGDGTKSYVGAGAVAIVVDFHDGKVATKFNNATWPGDFPTDAAVNPPDKPEPGVTKENFDRIDKGMSLQAVQDLLGPDWTRKPPAIGSVTYAWDPGVEISVTGDKPDDVVLEKFNGRGWPTVYPTEALAKPDQSVAPTREKYDKIDKGMTLAELLALLGPPSKAGRASGAKVDTSLEWGPGFDGQVRVFLKKGKVTEKSNLLMWPTAYPADTAQNPPPDRPPGKMSQATFDKIAKGMSLDDLTALCGKPSKSTKADPNMSPGADTHVTYFLLPDGVVGVDFADGKVVNKNTNRDWPVTWTGDVAQNAPPHTAKWPPTPWVDQQPDDNGIYGHAISRDGKVLAVSLGAGTLQFLDVTTGKTIGTTKPEFSPSGMLAVSSDGQQAVSAWTANGGEFTLRSTRGGDGNKMGNRDWLQAFAFWPDDKTIVVCNGFNHPTDARLRIYRIRFWLNAARQGETMDLGDHNVYGMAFCPDGKTVAVGGDGEIRLFDLGTKKSRDLPPAHKGQVECLAFSADGKTLASSGNGQKDKPAIWDVEKGQKRCELDVQDWHVLSLALSPDGKFAATGEQSVTSGRQGGPVRLWDATTGKELARVEADADEVRGVYFAANDQLITIGPKKLRFWYVADFLAKPGDAAQNPAAGNPLTQANFDKIDKGMTLEDLTAFLGPPRYVQKSNAAAWDTDAIWVVDRQSISAGLLKGKVVQKGNPHGWPVTFPSEVAQNPPPDKPKPGVTQAVFDKIDKGMAADELFRLLGKPPGADDALRTGKDAVLNWMTADGNSIVDVTLSGGKVTRKGTTATWPVVYPGDAAVNPQPAIAVTQANFDKIDKGMTLDDLTKLLGGPPTSTAMAPLQEWDTQWTWRTMDGVYISAQAVKGKTVNKQNGQKWPVVWPGVAANPPPDKPPPDKPDPAKAVNKDNFDKIAKGMSRDALLALFGTPTDVKPQPQPGIDERLIWQGDGVKILVGVTGGKVVSKLNTADWPVVYPK